MRPIEQLNRYNQKYSTGYNLIDEYRRLRGKDVPNWPKWCFLPMAGFYAIICKATGNESLPPHLISDVSKLAAICTWRYSQGVYRFDSDVFDALWTTKLSGYLPADVLLRLPEWSIYVETPDKKVDESILFGFWVHLEHDANNKRKELRFVLDTDEMLIPIPVHIGSWPLEQALEKVMAECSRNVPSEMRAQFLDVRKIGVFDPENLMPLVSLVLYLCSDMPDFGADKKPVRPKAQKTKKHGWRLFQAPGPTIWHIGHRVGRLIREAHETEREIGSSRSVKSHIRRAHWHGYWSGPLSGPRRFTYQWMPPIAVGIEK
jgi:hypothetical protein